MTPLVLAPSPRLYVSPEVAEDLHSTLHSPFLQTTAKRVLRDANWLTRAAPVVEGASPQYGQAGRWVQSHLECLTCAWVLTRKAKYRQAAMRHLAGLLKWNHISCEANVATPAEAELPYCLTYAEQSMTIGLMYDLFRPELTSDEQQIFFDVLDRFHLKEAVRCLDKPPWWVNKSWSNWNGVCCGGMGVMALALYDDRPEVRELIPFVEASLSEYFSSYVTNGGGCTEGTGYWNYGMNYAMRYVLSWENATGRRHSALQIKEIGRSLYFPLDFTGLSFGDNDNWHPTAFYFLLARRLKLHHAALRAATFLPERVNTTARRTELFAENGDLLYAATAIPDEHEMRRLEEAHRRKKVPVARIYKGMDWAALADDEAFPKLRMSVRGGHTKGGGHEMVDLLSFHCRVNGELMITDQADTDYLTTTFGRRGTDIYTRGPESKSTLFVEGLGCAKDVECDKTELVNGGGITGVRIDATHIYLQRLPVKFIGRLFLFVDNAYWLVIDQVVSKDRATLLGIESRFHTYASYHRSGRHVALKSGDERMQVTFAGAEPCVMQESRGMPPLPTGEQTSIFRWMGKERSPVNLHVVGLFPGRKKLGIEVRRKRGGAFVIGVTPPGARQREIHVSSRLRLRS